MKKPRTSVLLPSAILLVLASCGPTTASSSVSESSLEELPNEQTGLIVDTFADVTPIGNQLLNEPIRVYAPSSSEDLTALKEAAKKTTVTLLRLDDGLNVMGAGGEKLGTWNAVYLDCLNGHPSIPAVYLEAKEALHAYLLSIRKSLAVNDSYIVSDDLEVLLAAGNDEFAKLFSLAFDARAAKLENDEDYYLLEAAATAAGADTIILDADNQSLEAAVEYLNARFKNTWVMAEDGELPRAVCSGAYGIVSGDLQAMDSLLGKFSKAGRTRKQFLSAHRGLTTAGVYNQNSLPAIADAYDAGATHVEIDLQITKDNVVVVCHDDSPAYFSSECPGISTRFISENWDDIKHYRLDDNGVDEGNTVPTLEEALLAGKGSPLVYMLELKMDWCSERVLGKDPMRYVEEIVRKTGMEKQVLGISYFPPFIEGAREHSPWMPLASIGYGPDYNFEYVGPEDPEGAIDYFRKYQWGCDYSMSGTLFGNAYDFLARGYPINSYTYKDQSNFKNASNIVTTDVAEKSKDVIAELTPAKYIYLENVDGLDGLTATTAETYGHASVSVPAEFILLEGDTATDQYLHGTFYYYDAALGHGLYSPEVIVGNGSLGADPDFAPVHEKKSGIVLPDSFVDDVYGA